VQSACVTRSGEAAIAVLGSFNREEGNIPEGCSIDILPFNHQEQRRCYAYSKLLMKDAIIRELEVTQLNVKGIFGRRY
jgi:hypothetical protein